MNGPFLILRAMVSALRISVLDDHLVSALVVARLLALGEFAPRRAGVTTTTGAPFTTTHGMVDWVHGDAAVVGAATEPSGSTSLTKAGVLRLEIGDLPNRCAAQHVNLTHLTARKADLRVLRVTRHQLPCGTG